MDAIDLLLDAIHRDCPTERPTIEMIEGVHGYRVEVGLWVSEVPVMIWPAPPGCNYFIALNPLRRLDDKRVEDFWLQGTGHTAIDTEFPIPIGTARRVVREFFLTGSLATDVSWRELFY